MRQRSAKAFVVLLLVAVPLVLWAQSKSYDALKLGNDVSTTTTFKPRVLSEQPVQVVLKMSADPVAIVRSRAANHVITREAEAAAVAAAHAQHVSAEPHIMAVGGRILGHYHHAINGVKVEIAPSQLSRLASIPGVVAVLPVRKHELDNAVSVPFIGAPQVWSLVPGFRGEGIKIGIIDTGVDYTHANFGGPGTVAAWNKAFSTSTQPADPALFGPNAPKVKGGTDLVGDNYNANFNDAAHAPMPDPNPLDCNGHGSHVSGTAAGFGVLASGSTYTGPYNTDAYKNNSFTIGPGVAPKADLYMIRVFGCSGSTNVVVDAIDWAVANNMDVISMSLGADFGQPDFADSVAAANAAKAGIAVVAASGNAGPGLYITSSPASGDGVIAAAAMDATRATYPAAKLALTPGGSITVQNSNGAAFTDGTSMPIVVLYNTPGIPASGVSLGCNPNEYSAATGGTDVTGKLVVTVRGSCARVFRAGAAQHFGGIGAAMINNGPGYPPFEGEIPGGAPDPNTGNIYEPVHIPFFGVLTTDAAALTGATSTIANNSTIPNLTYEFVTSFSSGGPLQGTSAIKPSLTAPGLNIVSTAMGTGNQGVAFSGTSMATPHIAGVAALVRQAHPTWSSEDQRAAILQTGDPGLLKSYQIRLGGAGVVQPFPAVETRAVVFAPDDRMFNLSFGEAEMSRDFRDSRELTVVNHGNKPVSFDLSSVQLSGAGPATVTFDQPSVFVPAHGNASFRATLKVPTTSVGPTHDPNTGSLLFQEVSGLVTLMPEQGQNNGVSLRLPYYLVPRVRSNAFAVPDRAIGPNHPTFNLQIINPSGATAALPDFYSLGNFGQPSGIAFFDPRAVGVQAFPRTATDNYLVFALNTWTRFNNPADNEVDICIFTKTAPGPCDTAGVVPDFYVIGIGGGFLSSSLPVDRTVAAIFNPHTGGLIVRFFADAPTDGSTVLLPVRASDLGITHAAPTFAYTSAAFNEVGLGAGLSGTGLFNAFTPALTVAPVSSIAPNSFARTTVTVNPSQWAVTPPAGLMMVVPDNPAGGRQAQIIRAEED
jgi:minor extracellular serine protease Vpr